MARVKFIPVLFLLFTGLGLAQDLKISHVDFPPSYRTGTINDMAQDPRGNIWMASMNQGLLKYDGTNFTQFAHERDDPNSLPADRLECVLVDREGIIWIGGFDAGLSRFDPITEIFTHFQHSETDTSSLRSNSIRSLAQDHEGTIWIGTVEGLDQLDPISFQVSHHLDQSQDALILDKEHIRVLFVDREGTLWAGGSSPFYGEESNGGLFKINVKTKNVQRYYHTEETSSLIDNRVTALYEDSQGNFWVGTVGDGLHIMNRQEGTFNRYTYDPKDPGKLSRPPLRNFSYAADHIRSIEEDDQGHIWIGTMGNGINRFDPKTKSVQFICCGDVGNNGLPSNLIWNYLKTRDGLLWISSWQPSLREQILVQINLTPNELYQKEFGIPIYSFAEGENENIYMGSNNLLIQIDKGGNERIVEQFDNLALGRLNHLNKDNQGNLWISSETGLYKYNITDATLDPYTNGLQSGSPETNTSEIIDNNRILVGTVDGLYLFELDQERFTKIEHTPDDVKSQTQHSVLIILKDSRNNIWIGLQNYGLKRFDLENQEFVDYPFVESVQNSIRSIYEDDYNNLYVGGGRSGLRQYYPDLDRFVVIKDESGLLTENTSIGGMKTSGDSILWAWSTSHGGMIKYDIKTNTGFLFDNNWLKPGTGFSAYGIFKSSNDDFYFGTSTGFVKFRTDDYARKSNYKPSPFVSKFQVNNELVSITDSVTSNLNFTYDQNDIAVTLGYINFLTGSGGNSVKYRLEQYDSEWREGKNDEEISYYRLPPGTYTFRIKAMDVYGEWTEQSLAFSIKPPWWKTWWAYLIYAFLFVMGVIMIDRYQRRRLVARERAVAREKELAQAKEIQKAYTQLKATQSQLVHAEKMASLGELTAGIAHEIQNPLNFVNNFSEVSSEMIDEATEELDQGDLAEAKNVLKELKTNLDKINHHGIRASSIVRNMLAHSQARSGDRELADINQMADEYLRLAYHGFRAKDNGFKVTFETNLDKEIPPVKVITQDIGRVLLNLINNAFYACTEKSKKSENGYSPKVTVTTTHENGHVKISVQDNGTGIPDDLVDKVFQPFFTTKPTGSGTGLGLSLSYDIIKAHGGDLHVESVAGTGTTFTILLNVTNQ